MQRLLIPLVAWTLWMPVMSADEIVTLDGRTFQKATARRLDDDRLLIQHSAGETPLFFLEVPEPVRRRLGFDTDAALKRLTLESLRLRGTAGSDSKTTLAADPKASDSRQSVPVPQMLSAARPVSEPPQAARWSGLIPPAPAAQLPPVTPGQEINVWELVNHYRSDPAAADARYRKRPFHVTGVVERMERGIVSRNVRVFLETPDPAVRPVCEWRIDDKIPAFHTRRDGRTLIAENNRSRWKLLEAGQTVTFEIQGGGLEDGLVELKQARLKP